MFFPHPLRYFAKRSPPTQAFPDARTVWKSPNTQLRFPYPAFPGAACVVPQSLSAGSGSPRRPQRSQRNTRQDEQEVHDVDEENPAVGGAEQDDDYCSPLCQSPARVVLCIPLSCLSLRSFSAAFPAHE
jgi:hypothetical protein